MHKIVSLRQERKRGEKDTMEMNNVLIVEDDKEIREGIER